MARKHDSTIAVFLLLIGPSLLAMTSCATDASSRIPSGKQVYSQDERQLVSECAYFGLPDGSKILLRYSTIDDVIRSLGEPFKKDHHERGSKTPEEGVEGGLGSWEDYSEYEYGNGHLIFFVENKSRRVIAISSAIPGLEGSTFPFGLNRNSIMNTAAVSIMSTPAVSQVNLEEDWVSFALGEPKEVLGGVAFDSQGSAYLYYVFYLVPWRGYSE